jgi:tyrosyl-tRNA synthetase
LQQFLTRDNFKLRWEKGDAIYLHETFYTIMQGYDAYILKADVQIGGTDQLFNIMTAARKIMTSLGAQPNIAIILGILPGTDGVVKMSKSLGNHIPINTDATDMYGKVMSIPDMAMGQFFRLVTRLTPPEIAAIENGVKEGKIHPRDAKMKVGSFYGDADAVHAESVFVNTFQKGAVPDDIPQFTLTEKITIVDLLVITELAKSKTDARRLIEQKGVKFEGKIIEDPATRMETTGVLQIGKRHFLNLVK